MQYLLASLATLSGRNKAQSFSAEHRRKTETIPMLQWKITFSTKML